MIRLKSLWFVVVFFFTTASISLAEQGRSLLERLISGQEVPLSHSEFREFREICVIGWQRLGIFPERVYEACPRLRDHSMVGIRSDGSCEVLISHKLRREYLVNFANDGDVRCADVPSDNKLIVYPGVRDITRDRLDISPKSLDDQ